MKTEKNKAMTIRQLILPLYLPTFLLAVAHSTMTPILPLFADSFKVGYSWIGLVLAGQGLGTLLGDVPAGMILHRLGIRKTMFVGVLTWGLCTLSLFWVNQIWMVFILQIIGGFGFSFYGVARMLLISDKLPSQFRGRAVSLVGGVFRMGRVVGPFVAGLLAVNFELRSGFIFFFLMVCLAFIVLFFFMPEFILAGKNHEKGSIGSVARENKKIFLTGGSGQFILSLLRSGPRVIIPLFGVKVLGLAVDDIGAILSLTALLDMFLFIPAGWIMDNLGRKFSVVPSIALLGISLFLIPFTTSYNGLLAMALIGGFGNGISAGLIMTLGADFAPAALRGEFLGIWRLIGDGGNSASPLIVGALADLLSLQQTTIALSGFSILGVLIFAFTMPEPLKYPIWRRRSH
ncbi:MAG: MFS transporter [Anaerolineaceae bacterium]|nr:MFS transporter [Anaerolineaceae bacterium]